MLKRILLYLRHHYAEIYKIFLFLVCIVVIVLIFPKEAKFKYEYTEGLPWLYEDLFAPNDFPLLKTQSEISYEKAQVLALSKYYFDDVSKDEKLVLTQALRNFDSLWVRKYGNFESVEYASNQRIFKTIFNELSNKRIIDVDEVLSQIQSNSVVVIIKNKIAKETIAENLLSVRSANTYVESRINAFALSDKTLLHKALQNIININLAYNKPMTIEERDNLLKNLSPSFGAFQKGRRIISKGEIVDKEKYKVLNSLKKDFEIQTGKSNVGIIIGQIILVTVPILAFVLFMIFFRADIFEDNTKLILIMLLNIMQVFITRLAVDFHTDYLYMVPLLINLIIIRSFFDTRLALIVHLITVILISFIVPNSFEFVFIQLVTGIITNVSIVKLERRSQFFITAFYIFISYSVIYCGMVLISEGSLANINFTHILYLGISAALTLFAYPLIWVFERIFGFITDVSLLEYADTNNGLLRELANKAPGTFQHSVMVANLAEESIRKIGGNTLLVRAGAMYHDIGKMDAPMFFTENQTGSYNPHDELTSKESVKMIIGHVIGGIEKAQKHKIPEQIIDFIRTHHGTKKVEYFYRMSKIDRPDEYTKEDDYTYHGPIPFTKETCVLMMADAIEAASRSLKDPDEQSVTQLVERIVKSQFDEGQFDQAKITLQEINQVKKVMIKKLLTIYHVRVQYPE